MSSLKKMVLVPFDMIKNKRAVNQGYEKLQSSPKKKKKSPKKSLKKKSPSPKKTWRQL